MIRFSGLVISRPAARCRLLSTGARLHAANHSKTKDSNTTPHPPKSDANSSNTEPVSPQGVMSSDGNKLSETPDDAEQQRMMQAPNRRAPWSRSQQPRDRAMVGPRFEQTLMEYQPQPEAAINLIHQQPVRWTKERKVSCDGGGGPLGHPRIFINVDKPQICWCTYCGLPFANEHHRKMLESRPSTTYPLQHTGSLAEVPESQRVTDEAFGQR